MYHYGILGFASITPRFIQGIKLSEKGKVSALASRNQDLKLDAIEIYDDYQKLLQDPKIDVIYVPTPNYLHFQHAKAAITALKHVIVEKPFTMTYESGKRLFDLAQAANVFIMEAQKIVFLPSTNWLKEQLAENLIGKLESITLRQSFAEGDQNHWMYDDSKGGGVVYGSGNYPLEFMMHLFDTTDFKDFKAVRYVNENLVDEVVDINFKINEIEINAYITRKETFQSAAIFRGSKGEIIVEDFWRAKKAEMNFFNKPSDRIYFDFENEFKFEVDHINQCLEEKLLTSPIMKPEITLACLKYIDQIKETEPLPFKSKQ